MDKRTFEEIYAGWDDELKARYATIVARCKPCVVCGESGTWGEDGVCYDCKIAQGKAHLREQRYALWPKTLNEMSVPKKYQDVPATLSLPADLSAWRGKPAMLTLVGPTGVGKTWTGVRLLGELYVQADMKGHFADATEVVAQTRKLRERWQEGWFVEDLTSARVLLLDDLAAVRMSTSDAASKISLDVLAYVLRHRDSWSRPTIITTNKTLGEWAKQEPTILEPLVSRLAGEGLVRTMKGTDRRPKKEN